MKKNILISAICLSASIPAFSDQCPSAENIRIVQNSDKTFTVNVPDGYSYQGDVEDFGKIDPIVFLGVMFFGFGESSSSFTNVKPIMDMNCLYGFEEDPTKQLTVSKMGTTDFSYDLGKGWNVEYGGVYSCFMVNPDADCRFTQLTSDL